MPGWISDLLSPSWLPLMLGSMIAILAIADAIVAKKKRSEPALKVMVVTLTIILIFAQSFGGKAASKKAAADLKTGLDSQREEMTKNFEAGTAQIIKAATESATKSLEASRKQYDSTINHVNGGLNLSKRNLDALAGTGSYPCIVPQPFFPDGKVPLAIWNYGRNNLTGVVVKIYTDHDFEQGDMWSEPAMDVGTINNTWPKQIPSKLDPAGQIGRDGLAHFVAEITTQNGLYSEVLNFRPSRSGGWAYQFWLNKQSPIVPWDPHRRVRWTTPAHCTESEWSDNKAATAKSKP